MPASRYNVLVEEMTTYIVEDRRAEVSPYGRGNSKLGPGIYTYSLPPVVSCPGATDYCKSVCYARNIIVGHVIGLWERNRQRWAVPEPPTDAKVVRWHVGGDFHSDAYVRQWTNVVRSRPDVQFFGYTRSWRVPDILRSLEVLRDEPNVQLFASVDPPDHIGPAGWRRAIIDNSGITVKTRGGVWGCTDEDRNFLYCPEETGQRKNCMDCRYCIDGQRGDVAFLEH